MGVRRVLSSGLILSTLAWNSCVGQASPSRFQPSPRFDLVVLKKSDPSVTTEDLNYDHGRINGHGVTVRFLVEKAFGVQKFQIEALPRRIAEEKYDLSAKVDDPAEEKAWDKLDKKTQNKVYQERLTSVLVERLHLKGHLVTKEVPGFALRQTKTGKAIQDSRETDGFLRMHRTPEGNQIEAKGSSLGDLADLLSIVVER